MKNYLHYKVQCTFSGKLFASTVDDRIDSVKFVEKLMLSPIGDYYYSQECVDAWLGPEYVMEDLNQNFKFEKGETLPRFFMYWLGFLYRFWSMYTTDSASEIYNTISIEDLLSAYDGLHVMDWPEVIAYIKDDPKDDCLKNC